MAKSKLHQAVAQIDEQIEAQAECSSCGRHDQAKGFFLTNFTNGQLRTVKAYLLSLLEEEKTSA